MKGLVLLILIGIAAFFAALILPGRDIVKVEQMSDQAPEELNVLISDGDEVVLEELADDFKESEAGAAPADTQEVVSAEQVQETVVETPDAAPLAVIEEKAVVQEEEKPKVSFSEINTTAREALVNIFCTTKSGGSFKPITGSGVIIDERGVILTNAHVAQYFLLKDYLIEDFVDCIIRTESPARSRYKAIPIFISPSWIKENANEITQQAPKGTGEDDYALLLITGRTNINENLPETFSFISPEYNSGKIEVGDNVLLAAYPAGFLGGISITKDLYIGSTVTQIMEVFTFREGTLDLFSVGGSVVAQQGSSGGAVVGADGKLLGIIVTSSAAENTQNRDLRAITIGHINRSFVKDTGFDLHTLFSGDLKAEANAFNENIAPRLTQLLADELAKQ